MIPSYQVDYRINGTPTIFEFYLFVNPLGQECLNCEKSITAVFDLVSENIDIHMLPYSNAELIQNFAKKLQLCTSNLSIFNTLYQRVYLASLAYKAASLQSKKNGRALLMRLQQFAQGNIDRLTRETIIKLAQEINLDLEVFLNDLESELVKKLYLKDQLIAREMRITQTPALVICEHQTATAELILAEDISIQNIFYVLDQMAAQNYYDLQQKPKDSPHLKIVSSNKPS